jgi:hypothetical protein
MRANALQLFFEPIFTMTISDTVPNLGVRIELSNFYQIAANFCESSVPPMNRDVPL